MYVQNRIPGQDQSLIKRLCAGERAYYLCRAPEESDRR